MSPTGDRAETVRITLETLIQQVESARDILLGNGQQELLKALHDDVALPEPEMEALAGKAINLLHETQQLLEPGNLILADHFLGTQTSLP